jgi:hypothetical protein
MSDFLTFSLSLLFFPPPSPSLWPSPPAIPAPPPSPAAAVLLSLLATAGEDAEPPRQRLGGEDARPHDCARLRPWPRWSTSPSRPRPSSSSSLPRRRTAVLPPSPSPPRRQRRPKPRLPAGHIAHRLLLPLFPLPAPCLEGAGRGGEGPRRHGIELPCGGTGVRRCYRALAPTTGSSSPARRPWPRGAGAFRPLPPSPPPAPIRRRRPDRIQAPAWKVQGGGGGRRRSRARYRICGGHGEEGLARAAAAVSRAAPSSPLPCGGGGARRRGGRSTAAMAGRSERSAERSGWGAARAEPRWGRLGRSGLPQQSRILPHPGR